MHISRLAALCTLLLGLAACVAPGPARITNPPPHMGDGTEML
jgi:hypothetical protein